MGHFRRYHNDYVIVKSLRNRLSDSYCMNHNDKALIEAYSYWLADYMSHFRRYVTIT